MRKSNTREWTRYRAYPDQSVELLRARYVEHRYEPHVHETYAFGLVEGGRQTFACRGERFYSTGGSIFAINPGDAHDGAPADEGGFLYRMIYVAEDMVRAHLASLPLFRSAMFFDAEVARGLAAAHDAFAETAPTIEREHCLAAFLGKIAERTGASQSSARRDRRKASSCARGTTCTPTIERTFRSLSWRRWPPSDVTISHAAFRERSGLRRIAI